MNVLLNSEFFNLLAEISKKVTNEEMKTVYENFVRHIMEISNSEDYSHIFRMLNLTRIEIAPLKELYRYEQGEKCA